MIILDHLRGAQREQDAYCLKPFNHTTFPPGEENHNMSLLAASTHNPTAHNNLTTEILGFHTVQRDSGFLCVFTVTVLKICSDLCTTFFTCKHLKLCC